MVFSGIRILFLSLFLVFFSSSASAAPDVDVDRDGFSDIFFVSIGSDKSLTWQRVTTGSSRGTSVGLGVWGVSGDMLAPGAWFAGNQSHLGTVSLSDNEILWKVRDSNGASQQVSFGNKGNMVLSGGDYNDNGLLDGVIASKSGTVIVRTEMMAQFVGKKSSDFELNFGSAVGSRGKLFFMSPEGQGDHVAFLVRKKRKLRHQYVLYRRDIFNNLTKVRLRGSGHEKLKDVFPVEGPDGSDYIGIVSRQSGKLVVTVRTSRGSIVNRSLFKTGSFAMTGDYLSDPGHEIAVKTKKGLRVINPVSKTKALFTIPSGIPADHVNRATFGRSSGGGSGGGGDDDQDDGGSGGGPGLSRVCGNINNFSTGVLYKPDSDVSDNRGGKPVLLYQGSKKPGGSSVDIYATDGTKICNFTFKAPSEHGINGNADHYYSGWVGGCSKTGGQIAALAKKASGSTKVYIEGRGNICYGPVHPDDRSGGIF